MKLNYTAAEAAAAAAGTAAADELFGLLVFCGV